MSADLSVTWRGGVATAALRGEFDMQATFTVEPELERLGDDPGLERLVIDLSELTFVDSTGIGVLVRTDEELRRRGVPLSITPGSREVQRVFEVAGLGDALPFET